MYVEVFRIELCPIEHDNTNDFVGPFVPARALVARLDEFSNALVRCFSICLDFCDSLVPVHWVVVDIDSKVFHFDDIVLRAHIEMYQCFNSGNLDSVQLVASD